ncbi:hypothetical protein FKM82_021714 [Ascaphus truei]
MPWLWVDQGLLGCDLLAGFFSLKAPWRHAVRRHLEAPSCCPWPVATEKSIWQLPDCSLFWLLTSPSSLAIRGCKCYPAILGKNVGFCVF